MPTPNEKLADSLKVLKALQDQGVRVFRPSILPSLTRVHRERLVTAGFLKQIVQGWYLPNNPEDADGDSTLWYANMEVFVAAYATERFGSDWQLSAELSILKHSGHTSIAKQLQVQAPKANNNLQELPHGCSMFLYRIPQALLAPERTPDSNGMMLMPLPDALVRVSPTFFTQYEMASQVVMRQVDVSLLIARLLDGGHSRIAGRMAGALRAVGRDADANQLVATMKAALYTVTEGNPFKRA
ncbi:MAG TPA: hypothetical protein VL424_13310 [Pararobbsia sp.]|nr:hypothetical protein [Pararobbsia sp.]